LWAYTGRGGGSVPTTIWPRRGPLKHAMRSQCAWLGRDDIALERVGQIDQLAGGGKKGGMFSVAVAPPSSSPNAESLPVRHRLQPARWQQLMRIAACPGSQRGRMCGTLPRSPRSTMLLRRSRCLRFSWSSSSPLVTAMGLAFGEPTKLRLAPLLWLGSGLRFDSAD